MKGLGVITVALLLCFVAAGQDSSADLIRAIHNLRLAPHLLQILTIRVHFHNAVLDQFGSVVAVEEMV